MAKTIKILLAPDKFRGSLTAQQVVNAMSEGIRLAIPNAEVVGLPLADGGEGTAEVLTQATGGIWHTIIVRDPLGRPVEAGYGLSGTTAFVELAQASGLRLLKPTEYDPLQTNTYGTGELLRAAVEQGAQHIILGIGGSATNDTGIGMAAALGWRFLDSTGQELTPSGAALKQIVHIIAPVYPVLPNVRVTIACDVTNVLYGRDGAAYVYGPQKGATLPVIEQLDAGLQNLAHVIQAGFGVDVASVQGAGAAGGMGAGALFFLNATLKPGSEVVLDAVAFDQHMTNAALVLTGEGKIDQQTLQGKLLKGVTERAQQACIPVVALCGTLDLKPADIATLGMRAAFSVLNRPQSLDEAFAGAYDDVRQATFGIIRLFCQ